MVCEELNQWGRINRKDSKSHYKTEDFLKNFVADVFQKLIVLWEIHLWKKNMFLAFALRYTFLFWLLFDVTVYAEFIWY